MKFNLGDALKQAQLGRQLPPTGSGSESEPEKLPTGERFELYVDEDGDYVLKMKDRPSHHISVHGEHANEAVAKMVDTIHELEAMENSRRPADD